MPRLTRAAAVVVAALIAPGAFAGPALASAPAHRTLAAPTVTVSPNPISNTTKNAVTVAGSAAGATVAISISDGTNAPVTATAPVANGSYSKSAISVAGLNDGTLIATVTTCDATCTDVSPGGTGSATKDTVAPVTTLDVPAYVTSSPTTVSGDTDPFSTVVVKGTDSGDPLTVVTVTKTVSANASGHWTGQLDTSGMVEGDITWTATPTDVAGNAGTAVTKTSVKDVTAPSAPATVKGTPTRYLNGTWSVTGTTAMGNRTATDLTVDVTVTDIAGHVLTATNQPVTPAGPTGLAGTFSVPFGAAQMATLVEGTLTLNALFHDAAGNASPSLTGTAEKGPLSLVSTSPVDNSTIKPPATISATYNQVLSATGTNTTSTITVTKSGASVAGATAISGTTITFTPTAALTDGAYHVSVKAYDKFDTTVTSTDTFSFTADATAAPAPPVITTFTSPITAANQTMVTVSGTADLASTPVVVTIGSLANTVTSGADSTWTTTFDVTALADGTLTASATQSDGTKTSAAGTRQSIKDTVGPVKTSSTPADGATVASADTVSVTFGEPLAGGTITIPGVTGSSVVNGATVTFTPATPLADGAYTATANVTDAVGNPGTGATSFTLDSTPVTASSITLVAPAGVVIGQSVTLTGRVTQGTAAAFGEVSIQATTAAGQVVSYDNIPVATDGTFSKSIKPAVNATFRAGYPGDANNSASVSPKRTVLVASKVTASSATGKASKKAVITGSVKPGPAGTTVTVFLVKGSKATKIGTATVGENHKFTLKVKLPKGTSTLRAQAAATDDNAAGSVTFKAKRT